MENFVVEKEEPIIPQIEKFNSGKNFQCTALICLTEPEDIRRFFSEMTEMYRQKKPNYPDPRELARADLAYFSCYSVSPASCWERFFNVLKDEFEDAQKNMREWEKSQI